MELNHEVSAIILKQDAERKFETAQVYFADGGFYHISPDGMEDVCGGPTGAAYSNAIEDHFVTFPASEVPWLKKLTFIVYNSTGVPCQVLKNFSILNAAL